MDTNEKIIATVAPPPGLVVVFTEEDGSEWVELVLVLAVVEIEFQRRSGAKSRETLLGAFTLNDHGGLIVDSPGFSGFRFASPEELAEIHGNGGAGREAKA